MTGAPPPPMIPNGPTSPNSLNSSSQNTTMDKLQLNLSTENIYRSNNSNNQLPKGGWRPQLPQPGKNKLSKNPIHSAQCSKGGAKVKINVFKF